MIAPLNSIKKQCLWLIFTTLTGTTIHAQKTDKNTPFHSINTHFKNNRWDKGKAEIDNALNDSSVDSDLYMLKGKYFLHTKNYIKARYNLIKALKYDPNNVDAKQILVNVEIESKHYSSAICFINELLEVTPYWKGLWQKKIHVYRLQGNNIEANRLTKRINQIYPEDSKISSDYNYNLKTDIAKYKKEGELEKAIKLTNDLLKIDKKNPNTFKEVINTHLVAGDQQKALMYANRALKITPRNIDLIIKKASILSELNRYSEAIQFLKSKQKLGVNGIDKTYNYITLQAARAKNYDNTYTLYGKIFENNKNNQEALDFLLNTALNKGYYIDALYYIKQSKKLNGNTKKLLTKEYALHKQIGNIAKANKVLQILHDQFPTDYDIKRDYQHFNFKLAKSYIADKQYAKALKHISFLLDQPKNEYTENTLQSGILANTKLGKLNVALQLANILTKEYPKNTANQLKKIDLLIKLDQKEKALNIYEQLIIDSVENNKTVFLSGYEEIAIEYLKKIKASGAPDRGYSVIKKMLEINPNSEMALKFAINFAHESHNKKLFINYAERALKTHPKNIFFNIKYAEALIKKDYYNSSILHVDSLLALKPFNKALINAKTNLTLLFAKKLVKNKNADKLGELTYTALKKAPNNTLLKYYRGIFYEMKKRYDSAYYFQNYYQPSLNELVSYKRHMRGLKHKTLKNQIAFFHLKSRFNDNISVGAVSTLEYTRFGKKNTFVGRVNYAGRNLGVGIQPQFEWNRIVNKKTYFTANFALGTRFFPKISTNLSLFRSFLKSLEAQIGVGYRKFNNQNAIINGAFGLSKKWDNVWLNSKFNLYSSDKTLLYNSQTQAKFYPFNDNRSFLHGMFAFGSIPEESTLNFNIYNGLNAFNTMVGAGAQYMINSRLTLGILGNWHNFKDETSQYKNLYNVYLQTFFSF